MKSVYVICTLLGVTIGTLVLADNGAQDTTARQSNFSSKLSNADSSSITTAVSSNHHTNVPTTETTSTTQTTINTTTTITPSTTPTPAPNATTIIPTTTPITTTAAPSTTTSKPPKTTTQTSTSTSTTISTSTAASGTTAVPPAPPSKDRQFDGLSFFGGIILTTCLMAIAAFSWKFYRQCKEGNYRTL
ncbi:PREDICTED: integumentary mucin C.1-like [Wasmannia auropunctata]|uniref:integumentary mucin C.1-like n=1 Tax=Wasmannia auropunctata TaxID=64793 RepID=UPI0005EEBE0D|nr:PREDICTED: integumentary mucin C.1-like [Wasmannia auropunctata]